jgi:hypothetical protein
MVELGRGASSKVGARRRVGRRAFLAVVVLAALGAAACGGGGGSSGVSPDLFAIPTTTVGASTNSWVLFRPVLCIVAPYHPAVGTPAAGAVADACAASDAAVIPSTPRPDDYGRSDVLLPYYDGSVRYVLGPADMTGQTLGSTSLIRSTTGAGYEVEVDFTASGSTRFNQIAARRYIVYQQDPTNPGFGALEAIDVDGAVETAPAVQAASFDGAAVISGNSTAPFTAEQAQALAAQIAGGEKSSGPAARPGAPETVPSTTPERV